MEILIHDLHPGANRFQDWIDPLSLELDPEIFQSAVDVQTVADLEGHFLTVLHHVQTDARLVCDRCLTPFTSRFDLKDTFYYAIDPVESYDDDVKIVLSAERVIQLDPDFRDMLKLAVPHKCLCSQDCRGLCSVCGINLNEQTCECATDSGNHPFTGLASLRSDDNQK